jgi:hypothetical protein
LEQVRDTSYCARLVAASNASISRKLFVVAIEAVKAWIYLFSGHHEAALQICDVVMSMLDSEMSNLIFAIPSIVMVASIYLFLRQHDKFSQVSYFKQRYFLVVLTIRFSEHSSIAIVH